MSCRLHAHRCITATCGLDGKNKSILAHPRNHQHEQRLFLPSLLVALRVCMDSPSKPILARPGTTSRQTVGGVHTLRAPQPCLARCSHTYPCVSSACNQATPRLVTTASISMSSPRHCASKHQTLNTKIGCLSPRFHPHLSPKPSTLTPKPDRRRQPVHPLLNPKPQNLNPKPDRRRACVHPRQRRRSNVSFLG